ncbi:phosphate ABC transporter substrate-binding protein [Thiorhodococcus mannitoliphagus]|uniref:Phosphate ABC transporter substrate-binding protein n=2 Tax=Thiorhodococcus mannitoliphagus TaxID=329406 RepID=A0A6P1E1J0_9GAMM|nr:phosphate ABC transporter substrate-binding protein [Thiorhodococcus mannitoliphagus]
MCTDGSFRPLIATLLLLVALQAYADGPVVVVMSAASGVDRLTREEVVNIFLGRFRQLPNGQSALPVDQPRDPGLFSDFYGQLVDKTPAEIRSYWSRLRFSGKTAPPEQAPSEQEMLQFLASNPGSLGYLRAGQQPAQVKVVFNLGD